MARSGSIGLVPRRLIDKQDITFEDIRADVEPLLGFKVEIVNWFSTYRVHHRVAGRFRVGRAFLLGDAAHIHSPVGGQGMNTGVGDAMNLGWKLAQSIAGKAPPSLLDSYEVERIAFARRLVRTTDRLFTVAVASGAAGELARRFILPTVIRLGTEFGAGRRLFFRTLSQLALRYAESAVNEGSGGRVRSGDRLPWTGHGGPDNFAPLRSLGWQVHVYGDPSIHLREQVKLDPPGDACVSVGRFRRGCRLPARRGLSRPSRRIYRLRGAPDSAPVGLPAYAARMGLVA